VALTRVGVVPGVKMDSHKSTKKLPIVKNDDCECKGDDDDVYVADAWSLA
jgi:hypothetical protein